MITKAAVDAFLSQKSLVVAGVSNKKNKFGNIVYRELKGKGYCVFPVNPKLDEVEGDICCHNLKELPESVGGVVIVVPPAEAVKVVRDAAAAGIHQVWLQQGAESEEAVALCKDNGINVIYGHCILMFASPTAFVHRAHRYIWRLLGRLPR